jgi:Fe-S cluster biogenesis protein NfuA
MLGMCDGCPLSTLTLKAGIEELLKMRVPGIQAVEAL